MTLAAVAVLALGPTTSSSAPGENAVVHWSGVAANAIVVGRAARQPAPCSAGWSTAPCTTPSRRSREGSKPFATGVTAPPGASADAAVAQAARDVLVARVPGQAAAVQTAYDTYMASIPNGPAKDGARLSAPPPRPACSRCGPATASTTTCYVQPPPGPGVFEPIAPTPPVDPKLAFVRPFTYDSPSEYRPRRPARPDEQALRRGRGRAAGLRSRQQHRPDCGADGDRPLPHRADVLPVQPRPCVSWRSLAASTCASRRGCSGT